MFPSTTSSEDSKTLWKEVYSAFAWHRQPTLENGVSVLADAEATLNRMAAKCLRHRGESFGPANCTVRRRAYRGPNLLRLERYHGRVEPRRNDGPIVVLEYEGRSVVIDGNTRVNQKIASGDHTPQDAIVITSAGCDTSDH